MSEKENGDGGQSHRMCKHDSSLFLSAYRTKLITAAELRERVKEG